MKIDMVYPRVDRKRRAFFRIRPVCAYTFTFIAAACVIVNLAVGGAVWFPVALWGLWTLWRCVLSPDLVERNLCGQIVKALWYVCVLLALIDVCLAPGWAQFVIPIVGAAALIAAALFFFIDADGQRQNVMPLVWLVLFSLLALGAAGLGLVRMSWPVITLGACAGALALVGLLIFPGKLIKELRKRFHVR